MFYELGYAADVFEPDAATMATVRLMAPSSFLKSITFNGPYPYIDNVLFKGNSRTLEKLHLTIDLDFISIADKHRIFTRSQLVCLQSIQLYNCVPRIFMLGSLKRELGNTMRSIFTTTQSSISVCDVQLYGYSNFELLLSAIDNGLVFSWVQSIKIPDCLLSFSGIVQVIRSVRYLRVLHCSLLTEWPCVDGVEATELVWHIEAFGDDFGRYFYLLAIHNEMPFW
ncbi:hypothetical protein GGF37_003863 [Kickxella alabastrina]|nr:hypothetical protein GGF37_003863 [Kickxella alabastrina]